jgi:signal transduction histidine kinase
MPQGGLLAVALEEERSREPETVLASRGNGPRAARSKPKFAVLRIADEGEGIPEDIQDKIFDLYFTTKSGGSGIGLAMTYRILQLHHGSVEVQSRQVRGTEFRLRIPLVAMDRGALASQPASIQHESGLGR